MVAAVGRDHAVVVMHQRCYGMGRVRHVDTGWEGIKAGSVHLITVCHRQVTHAGPVVVTNCLMLQQPYINKLYYYNYYYYYESKVRLQKAKLWKTRFLWPREKRKFIHYSYKINEIVKKYTSVVTNTCAMEQQEGN